MPNHITNKLKINADKTLVQQIKNYLKTEYDNGTVIGMDFNKIIPMPKSLNIESGTKEDLALSIYIREHPDSEKKIKRAKTFFIQHNHKEILERLKYCDMSYKDLLELGEKYYKNILDYGHSTWYDWCNDYWGTKWNAYKSDLEDTEDTIYFLTAWAGVPKLIEMLSYKFPEAEFEYQYADEDFGCNVGSFLFKNGEKTEIIIKDETPQAYDLACEITQTTLQDHGLNENYEYTEEDN